VRYGNLEYDGFDWDEGNSTKIEARVAINVIEEFFKKKVLFKEDTRHSFSEDRFIAMGYIKNPKRCLFVAYTIRKKGNEILIRPISARFTHKKEEEAYEEQVKKLQEK
jgi:uncharacterized DUF497 family protein